MLKIYIYFLSGIEMLSGQVSIQMLSLEYYCSTVEGGGTESTHSLPLLETVIQPCTSSYRHAAYRNMETVFDGDIIFLI